MEHNLERLKAHILLLSEATSFETARREWDLSPAFSPLIFIVHLAFTCSWAASRYRVFTLRKEELL
jgi:hypothetical protein